MTKLSVELTSRLLSHKLINIVYVNDWYAIAKINEKANIKEKEKFNGIMEEINPENPDTLLIDIKTYRKAKKMTR